VPAKPLKLAGGNKMKRCCLYIRVSTGKQETENQEHAFAPVCYQSKDGKSFASIRTSYLAVKPNATVWASRPCCKLPAVESLMFCSFWALDRFSREGVLPTLTYLQRLDSLRCRVALIPRAISRFHRHLQGRGYIDYGYDCQAGAPTAVRAHRRWSGASQTARENAWTSSYCR